MAACAVWKSNLSGGATSRATGLDEVRREPNMSTTMQRRATSLLASTVMALSVVSCANPWKTPLAPLAAPSEGDWSTNGKDAWASRYSELTDITKENVKNLKRAWVYRTQDLFNDHSRDVFECTPLAVDGVVFVMTPFQRAIAIEGATGREIWSFDPEMDLGKSRLLASRGLSFWQEGEESRIILPTRDGRLISLDALTGRKDPAFGDNGVVNLREMFNANINDFFITSPPAVFEDLIIQGSSIPDRHDKTMHAPLVAVNIRTGEIAWKFNTVPQAGEFGADTWENESWRDRGGCNVWAPMSVDPEAGLVYLPVSAPNYDLYGGDRPGINLFSDCIVALDARTGQRRWHYQIVHHDLWDYDLAAAPNLVDLTIDGETIPCVAAAGKTGFIYVLNRLTGEPIFPIEERAVPQSNVPGEHSWPTQPHPTKPPPFSRQGLAQNELSDVGAGTFEFLKKEFASVRSDGLFTPPSLQGTLVVPGFHGGGNWSGAAMDLTRARMYVNSKEMISWVKLVETPDGDFPYRADRHWWLDQNGYPAMTPPWGQLTAIDLNLGEILWQKPLGEFDELAQQGVPTTGQENFGGATVTASGILFIGSTPDRYFRVFDADTGDILFKYRLPAAVYAAPITFRASDGKQYIVMCAGGGGYFSEKAKNALGDYVIAFSL